MGQARDQDRSKHFCFAHEITLTPSTTGPQTNKQRQLNKQMAHSATHEVDVEQWSPKTTSSAVTGMDLLYRKHTQPAEHAAKMSKEASQTEAPHSGFMSGEGRFNSTLQLNVKAAVDP